MRTLSTYFTLSLLALAACSALPYQDDLGFLVSAQANSPEFPVYVEGSLCKDMDGQPGLCSKRIKSGDDLKIHFDAQTYAYDLTMACTSPISVPGASVPKGQAFDLTIPNTAFAGSRSFVCIGEVFPQDRDQAISAKFEIRVVVVDSGYLAREAITLAAVSGKNYIVLGKYARSAWVFDGSKWSQHSKDTMVEIQDPSKVKAYSESYSMRFNSLNMSTPVGE